MYESVLEPVIKGIRGAETGELTEVFLKIHESCGGSREEEVPIPYEFTVTLVDAPEDHEQPPVDEPEDPSESEEPEADEEQPAALPPMEDAGATQVPGWLTGLLLVLLVAVFGLGAAVIILWRRGAPPTAGTPGAPPLGPPSGPATGA